MSLQTNITSLATRMATECKSLRTLINGNAANLSSLTTANKTTLVASINELKAALDTVAGDAAGIDDGSAGSATTWSSTKIATEINAAKDAILGGSAAALDTLAELAAALGGDANFTTTITTALAKRVRFDASQTLTGPEALQARNNIGAVAAADVGDTAANFVTTFEAGLT